MVNNNINKTGIFYPIESCCVENRQRKKRKNKIRNKTFEQY